MSALPAPPPSQPGFPRRSLLAATAGLAVLAAAGCTSGRSGEAAAETAGQVDRLAAQVAVQEAAVSAYAAATAADPGLGGQVAVLADQAREQLDRLRAAAPGAPSASSAGSVAPPPGGDVRGWLREQVSAAATAHAGACVDLSGAPAALLGSVAAGLRGHGAALA